MQVASILSDLTSLRVCDPSAAQKLVSAGQDPLSKRTSSSSKDEKDVDLQRAKDIVDLHNNVKVRLEERGLDPELEGLRERVATLVRELEGR